MKYIGLDAHKEIIVASILSDKGKSVKTMSVEASHQVLKRYVSVLAIQSTA